jgi:hypothetical protein
VGKTRNGGKEGKKVCDCLSVGWVVVVDVVDVVEGGVGRAGGWLWAGCGLHAESVRGASKLCIENERRGDEEKRGRGGWPKRKEEKKEHRKAEPATGLSMDGLSMSLPFRQSLSKYANAFTGSQMLDCAKRQRITQGARTRVDLESQNALARLRVDSYCCAAVSEKMAVVFLSYFSGFFFYRSVLYFTMYDGTFRTCK